MADLVERDLQTIQSSDDDIDSGGVSFRHERELN